MAGIVEIPQSIALGDPVAAEIFAVAVAAEGIKAVGTEPVDLPDIIRLQQIVRVKNQEGIVIVQAVVAVDLFQKEVERIAFADLDLIGAAEHPSAAGPGHLRCPVGAVIRHHIGGDQILGIVLGPDGGKQMGKDRFLVPGGDENGITAVLSGFQRLLLFQQRQEQIHDLIEITDGGDRSQHQTDTAENGQKIHSLYRLS